MISIEGRPAVWKVTISNLMNASLACGIPLQLSSSYVSMTDDQTTPTSHTVNVTITPEMSAGDVEKMLNALRIVQRVGSVKVIKDSGGSFHFSEGSPLDVQFTLVLLTPLGVPLSAAADLPISAVPDLPISTVPDLTLAAGGLSGELVCSGLGVNGVMTNHSIATAIQTVQEAAYPDGFNLGFELQGQPHRYTATLPPNVTANTLRDELSNLFAWQCDSDVDSLNENGRIFYHADYETSSESNRDNETAFCDHYSEKNPRTVWKAGTPLDPNSYRYVS